MKQLEKGLNSFMLCAKIIQLIKKLHLITKIYFYIIFWNMKKHPSVSWIY